jgi:hypothetical protein
MSRRTVVALAASVIVGIACIGVTSTAALAAKKSAHRTVTQAVVAPPPAAPILLIGAEYGSIADRVPKCFDSVISYPVPPCY